MKDPDPVQPDPADAAGVSQARLRILATTDLHAHLLPWDDLADQPAPGRSLAQIATLVGAARAEVACSVLLDNGDFLNGSPLADHVAECRPVLDHPVISAMNTLGYDAATLGNHEFSNGLALLRRALRQARFPVVGTNIDRMSAGRRRPFVPRSVILRRMLVDTSGESHALTIGIMGFLPPQTALWERHHFQNRLAVRDILPVAKREAARLRRAGADVVIALSHSGLGCPDHPQGAENVSAALAALAGVDAVVAGHTHQVYPQPQDGNTLPEGEVALLPDAPPASRRAALVMPGFYGSHLGVIDLLLARDGPQSGRQGWRVTGHQVSLRAVGSRNGPTGEIRALAPPSPAIEAAAAPVLQAMRRRAQRQIGTTDVALHSYFALIGQSAVQDLLASAQLSAMRAGLAGRPEAALPLLVAVAPFKAGGRGGPDNFTDIAAGQLTARNIADLYIHPNSAVALRLTGRQIADWLERAASLFHQIAPGARDAGLLNPEFPAYNFDMIHGVSFQIDLSQPARFDAGGHPTEVPGGPRVVKLCHQGQPIDPEARFVLVTNSYRASGGAGFAGTDRPDVVLEDTRPLRRILLEHVQAEGRVAPRLAADWRFCPMPGTSAFFDSAPAALPHAAAIPRLEPIGLQPTGFLRFRLRL